jgi:2-C-methyl-D-erythritol 4-phosphate cytidylyltransferase
METPQIFDINLLRRAYTCVAEQGLVVTDEVSAMETLGIPTRLVQVGPNLKITLPGDLELAELIFNNRTAE